MGLADLNVKGKQPFNAEPRSLLELTSHNITPVRLVYKRNHCMSPFSFSLPSLTPLSTADIKDLRSDSDTQKYTIKVDGTIDSITPCDLTFSQVRDCFPRKEVLAVLVVRPCRYRDKPPLDADTVRW